MSSKKRKHQLTSYIEILEEQADEWRNYAICCACRDALGRPTALLNKFSNKSERVKNHLKKCQHFISKVGSIKDVSRILDVELEEVKDIKAKKRCIESNLST
ncbi:40312_t:CDS:1, partial [Gigaspora margarita]